MQIQKRTCKINDVLQDRYVRKRKTRRNTCLRTICISCGSLSSENNLEPSFHLETSSVHTLLAFRGSRRPFSTLYKEKENENLRSCPNGQKCLKMVNYLAEFCRADHPWQAQRGLQSHQQELKDATKIDPPKHRGCSLMHQLGEGKVFKTERVMQTRPSKRAVVKEH